MSERLTVWRFATRLATDPGTAWMVAVVPSPDDVVPTGTELTDEIEVSGHSEPLWLVAPNAQAVEAAVREHPNMTLVVDTDSFDAHEWARLDRARARLEHEGETRLVFVMSEATERTAASAAPNLWSFLASSVYRITEDEVLSDDDRLARLTALRAHYGMSDDEVIEMVRWDELPDDPEFAEWLILMGRGELIERG